MATDAQLEHEITDFLAKDAMIDAMVDASECGRPAIEAIDAKLLRRFGDRVRPNPVKQRIGRLVRPVMETRGFVPIKRRQPAKSVLFTSGTVYSRSTPPVMDILQKHGIDLSPEHVANEIRSATAMIGGTPSFAQRYKLFGWARRPDVAVAPPAGPLGVFAITIDQALDYTAASQDDSFPASQLTAQQFTLFHLHTPAVRMAPSSIDPRTRTAFKLGALCATGLTLIQAGRLLHRDRARVEGWVRKRGLYSVLVPRTTAPRLPLFQLDDVGALVPHAFEVFQHLDSNIHPVGVFNWFTSPNPDLAAEVADFEPISPRDWLLRRYPPEPVSQLAGALAASTPA